MRGIGSGRDRRTGRSRPHRTLSRLARSQRIYRLSRGIPALVMLAGLYLILLGLAGSVMQFGEGLARLIDLAGLQGIAASSTRFVERQAVNLFGDAPPVMVAAPPLSPTPTLDIPPDPAMGFIPYRVAFGSREQAPALTAEATPALPVTGPTPTGFSAAPALLSGETPASPPPEPGATPSSPPADPERINIPAIGLDAPVVLAPALTVTIGGQKFMEWDAPNAFAAGWQQGSARLGETGNTVLNGHHNINGAVFARLRDLSPGDAITVYGGGREFHYKVEQVLKLPERDMPLAQREENARWIIPSTGERLTLVTCWPPVSNTYRLIVVAVPEGS